MQFCIKNFSAFRDWVFETTAAVLSVGNTQFIPDGTGSKIASDAGSVETAANLLQVPLQDLEHVLTNRSITVRGETSVIPLKPDDARDGTARARPRLGGGRDREGRVRAMILIWWVT